MQLYDSLGPNPRATRMFIAGKGINIAGNRFTIADVILYCALDFGAGVGQKIDPSLKNVNAWFQRVNSRPSATASLHPGAVEAGMRA